MKSKPLSKLYRREPEPCLRFTPSAWAKLLCLRDATDAEVGGFGLSDPDDLLLVRDILLVKQEVSSVSVAFDDAAVADLFEDLVEEGCHPEQFARLWMHTHPGSSPLPSSTDEDTFKRVFGECHWAVMFILARTGHTYARLRFGVGPGGEVAIPVEVDYREPFAASDHALWLEQYRQRVQVVESMPILRPGHSMTDYADLEPWEKEMLLSHEGLDPDGPRAYGL